MSLTFSISNLLAGRSQACSQTGSSSRSKRYTYERAGAAAKRGNVNHEKLLQIFSITLNALAAGFVFWCDSAACWVFSASGNCQLLSPTPSLPLPLLGYIFERMMCFVFTCGQHLTKHSCDRSFSTLLIVSLVLQKKHAI